jgi:BolA family transcriptional regulator, general stress-responsive regulator
VSGRGELGMAVRIKEKLLVALAPVLIEVTDESHKHAGHAHIATRPGKAGEPGETHFRVEVVSKAFKGKSRVDRHRMINNVLSAEIADGVHALAIDARAPDE